MHKFNNASAVVVTANTLNMVALVGKASLDSIKDNNTQSWAYMSKWLSKAEVKLEEQASSNVISYAEYLGARQHMVTLESMAKKVEKKYKDYLYDLHTERVTHTQIDEDFWGISGVFNQPVISDEDFTDLDWALVEALKLFAYAPKTHKKVSRKASKKKKALKVAKLGYSPKPSSKKTKKKVTVQKGLKRALKVLARKQRKASEVKPQVILKVKEIQTVVFSWTTPWMGTWDRPNNSSGYTVKTYIKRSNLPKVSVGADLLKVNKTEFYSIGKYYTDAAVRALGTACRWFSEYQSLKRSIHDIVKLITEYNTKAVNDITSINDIASMAQLVKRRVLKMDYSVWDGNIYVAQQQLWGELDKLSNLVHLAERVKMEMTATYNLLAYVINLGGIEEVHVIAANKPILFDGDPDGESLTYTWVQNAESDKSYTFYSYNYQSLVADLNNYTQKLFELGATVRVVDNL